MENGRKVYEGIKMKILKLKKGDLVHYYVPRSDRKEVGLILSDQRESPPIHGLQKHGLVSIYFIKKQKIYNNLGTKYLTKIKT